MSNILDYIKSVRLEKGLTAKEVALRCNYHRSYISAIENGKKGIPAPHTLAKIAKALEVPLLQLMLLAGHLTIDDIDHNQTNEEEFMLMQISPFAPKLPPKMLGEYLKQARIAAGYSHDQISDKLNISSATIILYEEGKAPATLATLKKMERFYSLKRYELTDRGGYDNREAQHQPKPEPIVINKPIKLSDYADQVSIPLTVNNSAPNDICAELLEEVVKARIKHPKPFNSAHEGYAILKEEIEELWEDIKRDDHIHARKELVQVGAMVIRFLLDVELSKTPNPIWTKAPGTVETYTPPTKKSWLKFGF